MSETTQPHCALGSKCFLRKTGKLKATSVGNGWERYLASSLRVGFFALPLNMSIGSIFICSPAKDQAHASHNPVTLGVKSSQSVKFREMISVIEYKAFNSLHRAQGREANSESGFEGAPRLSQATYCGVGERVSSELFTKHFIGFWK